MNETTPPEKFDELPIWVAVLVEKEGKEVIVCVVGKTTLLYDYRCLNHLHTMLKKYGDWMELGSADEEKPAKEGTVEAWGRSEKNPVATFTLTNINSFIHTCSCIMNNTNSIYFINSSYNLLNL